MSCCNNDYLSKNESIMIITKAREAAACAQANCSSSFTNATNAATSATNSANSATAAAASETNVENIWEDFQERYMGAYPAPPVATGEGALYWDTVTNQMYVWTGTSWVAAPQGNAAANPPGVKTVYLAPRTDGIPGSGTELDPYDAGGLTPDIAADKYDAIISNRTKCPDKCTIKLMAGTFYTKGVNYYPEGYANPLTPQVFYPKDSSLIGDGINSTTLQLVWSTKWRDSNEPIWSFQIVRIWSEWNGFNKPNVSISDYPMSGQSRIENLTIDGNWQNLKNNVNTPVTGRVGIATVAWAYNAEVLFDGVRAINMNGDWEVALECFALCPSAWGSCVVQNCIVENWIDTPSTNPALQVPYGTSISSSGSVEYDYALDRYRQFGTGIAKNNVVRGPNKGTAVWGIGTGMGDSSIIQNNNVQDCPAGIYADTGHIKNLIIENNYITNCDLGIHFNFPDNAFYQANEQIGIENAFILTNRIVSKQTPVNNYGGPFRITQANNLCVEGNIFDLENPEATTVSKIRIYGQKRLVFENNIINKNIGPSSGTPVLWDSNNSRAITNITISGGTALCTYSGNTMAFKDGYRVEILNTDKDSLNTVHTVSIPFVNVSSIVISGTNAIVTHTGSDIFQTGDKALPQGATGPLNYGPLINREKTVTRISATQFSFPVTGIPNGTNITGTIKAYRTNQFSFPTTETGPVAGSGRLAVPTKIQIWENNQTAESDVSSPYIIPSTNIEVIDPGGVGMNDRYRIVKAKHEDPIKNGIELLLAAAKAGSAASFVNCRPCVFIYPGEYDVAQSSVGGIVQLRNISIIGIGNAEEIILYNSNDDKVIHASNTSVFNYIKNVKIQGFTTSSTNTIISTNTNRNDTFENVIFDSKNSRIGSREYGNFLNCEFSGEWANDSGKIGTLVGDIKDCTFNATPEIFYYLTNTSTIENSVFYSNKTYAGFTGIIQNSTFTFTGVTNRELQLFPATNTAKINNLTLINGTMVIYGDNYAEITNSVIKPISPATNNAVKGDSGTRTAAIANCSTTATTPLSNITNSGLQTI